MKPILAWLVLAVLAVANGFFREALLRPRVGERVGHVLSTIILSMIILAVSFKLVPWIGVGNLSDAWSMGLGWLLATLAFEFLAGHYLFGNPWSKIVANYNIVKGRVWVLVPLTIVAAPPIAWLGVPTQFVTPYLVSLGIAGSLLVLATVRPRWCRWLFVALFAYAAIYNFWISSTRPEEYQGFATLALVAALAEFIRGPFREQAAPTIGAIATGQALIAVGFGVGRSLLPAATLGAVVFLMAIAPLGVGSAYPFSVMVSLAAIIVATLTKHLSQPTSKT